MFDLKLQSDLDEVPVPLPGRALIFADGVGALRARMPDGSVSDLQAGPRGESGVLVGEIKLFAGAVVPARWCLCDGRLVNVSDYPAAASVLGAVWGGDGMTVFGLPDLRGRVPVGVGGGADLADMGGADRVVLTVEQLPGHSHPISVTAKLRASTSLASSNMPRAGVALGAMSGSAKIYTTSTPNVDLNDGSIVLVGGVGSVGGGQPIATMPPFAAVNYIIYLG